MSLVLAGLSADANLQGYWNLNGNLEDSSANSYDLTNSGADIANGLFDGGYLFVSASGDYATIVDASCANLEIAGSQTWTTWVRATTLPSNSCPMAKTTTVNTTDHRLLLDNAGKVNFVLTGLTTNTSVTSDFGIVAGAWSHICGVYDSANTLLKVWVNGVKKEVTASGSANDTNGNFSLGKLGSASSFPLDGTLDEAAIFNRALTDAEVLSIYNAGAPQGSGFFM